MLTIRALIAYHVTVLLIALLYPLWSLGMALGLIVNGHAIEEDGEFKVVEVPHLPFGVMLDAAVNAAKHGFIHGSIQAGVPVCDIERAVRRVFPKEET